MLYKYFIRSTWNVLTKIKHEFEFSTDVENMFTSKYQEPGGNSVCPAATTFHRNKETALFVAQYNARPDGT